MILFETLVIFRAIVLFTILGREPVGVGEGAAAGDRVHPGKQRLRRRQQLRL
jgi:hypothetical protein